MRKALVIGLLLLTIVGCKRAAKNQAKEQPPGQQPAGQQQPPVHAPTGVVMNPSGGGSGGAAQAVRTAVVRTVNLTQMDQLRCSWKPRRRRQPPGSCRRPRGGRRHAALRRRPSTSCCRTACSCSPTPARALHLGLHR
ncbi:MAG: hypothetical protein U0736_24610 [Gemmataceae bacterium]